ncbi:MAG: stage II sporulation protein M [Paludibacteraceae bacterium]|nr:stage II sporulation protein M [Paludibacteraceae bacterium]
MKESTFIRNNIKRWERLRLNYNVIPVNELADAYKDILADLSYAQTQYPESRVIDYLNDLARSLHEMIYVPKGFTLKSLQKLMFNDVPAVIVHYRKSLLAALALFIFFVLVGVILAIQSEDNIRRVMGDWYVSMTLDNIANGEPTGVYSGDEMLYSFERIAINNILVTLRMFGAGIIPFLGPLYFMQYNGVMLGEFQTLFFLHDAGLQSMTAIWIHGAFEISSLVIAAGAGFTLAMGWVFPGTHKRLDAFKTSAQGAVRILCTTIPLFVVAAFFEGFVTRQVQWPLIVKLFIIFGSFGFIFSYYIYLPYKVWKSKGDQLENKIGW